MFVRDRTTASTSLAGAAAVVGSITKLQKTAFLNMTDKQFFSGDWPTLRDP